MSSLIPFIALRFLKTGSRRHFPFLTAISVLGVSLSVFSFVVIHSVMNGFSSHIREALIGFNAHVTITLKEEGIDPESIRKWLGQRGEVSGISFVSELSGVIEASGEAMAGVKIRGVDFEGLASPPPSAKPDGASKLCCASRFREQCAVCLGPSGPSLPAYSSPSLRSHSFPRALTDNGSLEIYPFAVESGGLEPVGARGGIVIGEELFYRLGLMPGGASTVKLLIPLGDVGPTGEIMPEVKEFTVTGVFSTGFFEQDSRYVLIARGEAERLSPLTRAKRQLFVRLKSPDQSQPLVHEFRKAFPGIIASPWQERDRRVLKALKLEKMAMILLLSIVTAIASFGILGLTTLLALRRLKDMALLQALGLPHSSLGKIPLVTGALIGLTGTLIGFALGLVAISYLATNPPLLPPAYYVDFLPVKIDPVIMACVFVLAPLLAIVAALWPARRFSKMATIDLLRST